MISVCVELSYLTRTPGNSPKSKIAITRALQKLGGTARTCKWYCFALEQNLKLEGTIYAQMQRACFATLASGAAVIGVSTIWQQATEAEKKKRKLLLISDLDGTLVGGPGDTSQV